VTQKILILTVLLCAIPSTSNGFGYPYYYPYGSPYRGYGSPYRPGMDLELSRLRRDLRNERLRDSEQQRRHQAEVNLLRQQSLTDHRITAQQACYYRTTGGFELCADLFAEDLEEFAECESMVIRRNPSCNELPLGEAR